MLMSTFFRNDFVRKCLANHILGGTKKMEGRSACERSVQWITGLQVEDIAQELKTFGFQQHGNETMYSPYTGKPIHAKIFMGPIYYQRLKHMVDDKIHARGRGRRNALTGQPNEGRKNGGGLRVGEMEKDSFNSHGVPFVINERMKGKRFMLSATTTSSSPLTSGLR